MPYAGPAPISVAIADVNPPAANRPSKDPKTLSASFTDKYEKSKATSLTVALADQDGPIWEETRGLENAEKLHYWASVGKSFTAVIIMQLVENKRLSLDDKLSNWVKNVPNGDLITVRMLLDHTSGLYSANEDQGTNTKLQRPLSLQDNIDILNKHGPLFCPGQYWRYSNTGYLFLGEIAEQIYGQSLREIIKVQIFDKIGLKNSHVLQVADEVSDIAKPRPSDDQKSDIRAPGPAGPIAATSSDMLRFWRAFLNGELVKPATRDQMLAQLYPMFDKNSYYGLGIMAMRVPGPDGKPVIRIGHAGGMPGIKAFVMIDPVSRQYVSVALTGDGPASAVAYNMLRKWQEAPAP
ncbi:hypothetical protein GCM10009096_06610 [Parasphingorhabdus litoris]|uniref:Beta-lactamase-related domain-containing protein n=2 Tax=Parasphingorhabdus litoris TaxID=394733 RepID=A0ABP3K2B4_9SPHN